MREREGGGERERGREEERERGGEGGGEKRRVTVIGIIAPCNYNTEVATQESYFANWMALVRPLVMKV